jgi:hypothetical protein
VNLALMHRDERNIGADLTDLEEETKVKKDTKEIKEN